MKRLLSRDVETGRETYFHSQQDGNKRLWIIDSWQDVTKYVERAKAEFNSTDERARWGEGQKVATIPLVVLEKLKREGIADDPKRMKHWLNDSENRFFRTRPGRV